MELMKTGGTDGLITMDCDDLLKEITKKLYGDEGLLEFPAEEKSILTENRHLFQGHESERAVLKPVDNIIAIGLAALTQNSFPPPELYSDCQPKTNPAAEDKWTTSAEALQWTQSRIASYNHAQNLFKCAKCECVGLLSRVAEHWLSTHSNARVFQCPQCAYGSSWARCVRAHLAREHNVPDDHHSEALCRNNPVLDEITKYLQRLKSKVDSVTSKTSPRSQLECRSVPSVITPASPTNDSSNVPPVAPNRYCCDACPYSTDKKKYIIRHIIIHTVKKPFKCYKCQKQFFDAHSAKKHYLQMHSDHPYNLRRKVPKTTSPFQLQYCSAPSVTTPASPTNHSSETPPASRNKYCCAACPYKTCKRSHFTRHMIIHRHKKPFECYVCRKQFNRAEHVKKHLLKMHRGYPYNHKGFRQNMPKIPPPFMFQILSAPSVTTPASPKNDSCNAPPGAPKHYCCADCRYTAYHRRNFTRHINIHSDKKPFKCYLCSKRFCDIYGVKRHFLNIHSDYSYDPNRMRRRVPKTLLTFRKQFSCSTKT